MENAIYTLLMIIAFMVVLELFELPDWIGRKLRGQEGRQELTKKINELEDRIKKLEENILNN